jgi:DNA-binding SARP family transcriptional activator/tetratricopeptide (TPR) repeat protein
VSVEIRLLGGFEVRINGLPAPGSAWRRRQAALLVKMLALAPRRTLHREQVMSRLWPDAAPDAAGPRLHKAAHFARRVLGPDSVVLRSENVQLFPETSVVVDTVVFRDLAAAAVAAGDPDTAEKAAAAYGGPLLPEDRYEPWAEDERDRLALKFRQVLRLAGRWQELADLDPTDEEAQLAVMRALAEQGDTRAALRHFERLDRALHRELGVGPSDEAVGLRDSLLAALAEPVPLAPATHDLVGRDGELAALRRLRADASAGRSSTVFVSGPPGVGKSALVDEVRREAAANQWYAGHGVAAAVEGAWPYAPVLDALAELCRHHPTLLDGLDDRYRTEIDRALAGRELDWSGEGGHQRLFVAVAELVRLAAAGVGALLVIDDVHEADDASLRLLHYLARSCARERLVLVLAHRRQPVSDAFEAVRASLLGRLGAVDLPLSPLDRDRTAALVRRHHPELAPDAAQQVWEVSGGLPFAVLELVRTGPDGSVGQPAGSAPLGMLSPVVRGVLERVAIAGAVFDTDEFLALSGLAEPEAFDCLDAALAALVIERTSSGYQFRHPLIREALLGGVPPHRQRVLHRECAERLIGLDASPARIGHHLVRAGAPAEAVPYALRAAETAAAVGAYRDALRLADSVLVQATGPARARLAALRADLLAATGDPAALRAYREAIDLAEAPARRELRARLARMAVLSGDLPAAEVALDGLPLDGDPTDATILLARGNLAYFQGRMAEAAAATADAYRLVAQYGDDWQALDLLTLQGLLAHHQGEFMHRLRQDLQRTRHDPGLATAVFDAQLCVVEIMLYGPMPYPEVIEFARDLRVTAERAGALRAVAFAAALIGEAALLSGDLDLAERELREAAELHRDLSASAGEAHSLQRLAEVHLARGDRVTAERLLHRALPLARWSTLALHLLQRVYGTMIMAAPDPLEARAVVERAEATRSKLDECAWCEIMFAVPAAVACARVGDVAAAEGYLALADRSAALWDGTAWQAMILEARAHVADATGERLEAARLLTRAGQIFADAGQPLDAARCRRALAGPASAEQAEDGRGDPGGDRAGYDPGHEHDRQSVTA